jgi:hypothetical protein
MNTPRTAAHHAGDTRPLVALDWSAHAVHVTFDGRNVTKLTGVEDLLPLLDRPHRVVAESTFESWNPTRRAQAITAIREAGHEIYVFRSAVTAKTRAELGWEKSDSVDARVIHRIASEGRIHLYPIPDPDPEWVSRREDLAREYLQIRLGGGKDDLAAAAKEILGRYRDLDPEAQEVLGNTKRGTYSNSILAVTYFAAQHTTTRAEFERLLGLHGSAYPSIFRSDVLHHSYRHARKRGVSWNAYRRQLRRTYRTLRAALTQETTPAAA